MWTSPNIKDHVTEQTDFKISKMFSYWEFEHKKNIAEYEYVHAGEYEKVILPDISANALRTRLEELLEIADQKEFTMDADYQAPHISFLRYYNILFYQIILFVNRLSTNVDFKADLVKTLFLLPTDVVTNLIISHNKRGVRTAKKVEKIEDYEDMLEKIKNNSKEEKKKTSEWLNIKIPNYDFTGIEEHPLYQKLLNEFGEKFIVDTITKLDKYKKVRKRDE